MRTNRPADITNRAATQIQEYLAGKRTAFDVPIAPEGSAFQKEVWAQVCELPYGATCTAAQLAERIGKAGSHRAVGTAISRNPIPMIIPTHRVDLPNATGKVARIYRANKHTNLVNDQPGEAMLHPAGWSGIVFE